MPLAPLTALLADARAGGYALGYFEAWDGYSLEAVVEAAEAERAPAIIGTGCLLGHQAWFDGGGIELLGALGGEIARQARVPVALLLNETHTLEQSLRGLDAGFNAVMMHTDDPGTVAQLVAVAHSCGAAVEGEFGNLPDAAHGTVGRLTDPEEAAAFVEATGVDCLAVSVGNVHLLAHGSAAIDLDRLGAIHEQVAVPLVIHGATGFPRDAIAPAIAAGVGKFNVGTVLRTAFLHGLTEAVAELPDEPDVHAAIGSHGPDDVLETGKAAMVEAVRNLIRQYGASGRAA
ncbi:MAG: class II fructose-bisphosphate aldolase [Gaiellaceae bacterium]